MSRAHCRALGPNKAQCTNGNQCNCTCVGCLVSVHHDALTFAAGALLGISTTQRPLSAADRKWLGTFSELLSVIVDATAAQDDGGRFT